MLGKVIAAFALLVVGLVVGLGAGATWARVAFPAPAPAVTPWPTPDVQATVEARVMQRLWEARARPPATEPTRPGPEHRALVTEFAKAYGLLTKEWGAFHRDYDAWLQAQKNCGREVMERDLARFGAQFTDVMNEIYSVERPPLVRKAWTAWAEAAEKELSALNKLRATWKPDDEAAFHVFEQEKIEVDRLRREVPNQISDLLAKARREPSPTPRQTSATPLPATPLPKEATATATPEPAKTTPTAKEATATPTPTPVIITPTPEEVPLSPEEKEAIISAFAKAHVTTNKKWDDLRKSYQAWRLQGGSCDQASVKEQLRQFAIRFHAFAGKVNTLERPPVILPLTELLVKAAQIEETALRELRDNWRPYDPAPWENFERKRAEVNEFRRQAAGALQTLLAPYDLRLKDFLP